MTALQILARRTAPTAPRGVNVRLSQWLIVLLLGMFIAGDGVATAIQQARGLDSPYVVIVPPLLAGLALIVVDSGRLSFRLALTMLGLGVLAVLTLLMQMNLFPTINLAGFLQLWLIFGALFAIQDLMAGASDGLAEAARRGVLALHWTIATYLVLVSVAWYLVGTDLSLGALFVNVPQQVSEYYGFRPAGLNREPAWAGFLLSATFIAVYFTSPKHRVPAFVALLAGVAALRSGTAFAFTAVAVVAVLAQRRRGLPVARSLVVAIVAAAVLVLPFGGRLTTVLEGADPSGLMRVDSASVAIEVIDDSFPLGVGYGNFREHAEYGSEFAAYIDLVRAPEYKSDIALLNLVAEFGFIGPVMIGLLAALYGRGRHLLLWAHFAAVLFLAGGLLIPSNMLIAAVIGLRERERRRVAEVPAVRRLPLHPSLRPLVGSPAASSAAQTESRAGEASRPSAPPRTVG